MASHIDETDEQAKQTMIRIIALLYSLAQLLERAVYAPRPVRRFVIWIMRIGEKRILGYVLDEAYEQGCKRLPAAMFEPRRKSGKAEALRIAACFRAMAWLLGALSGQYPISAPPGGWWTAHFSPTPEAIAASKPVGVTSRAIIWLRRAVAARARASPIIPDTS